jgi:hypothetical protein
MQLGQVVTLKASMCLKTTSDGWAPRDLDFIDYWLNHEHLFIDFEINNIQHKIEFALAPQSFIRYINSKEKYGVYSGSMRLVSMEVYKKHPNWVPYIALKMYASEYVDRGLDCSGKAVHWETLSKTIRLAEKTMERVDFHEFIQAIYSEETTSFFEIDGRAKKIVEDCQAANKKDLATVYLAQRETYFEAHHNNKWVVRARHYEIMAQLSPVFRDGNLNLAENIFNHLLSENQVIDKMFLCASFVKFLREQADDVVIELEPPFNSVAYILTKECNGLVDLVSFLPYKNVSKKDYIVIAKNRQKTWRALETRLAYFLYRSKRNIKPLLSKQKEGLQLLISKSSVINIELTERISTLTKSLKQSQLAYLDSAEDLSNIEGWSDEVECLRRLHQEMIGSIADLEGLQNLLSEQTAPVRNIPHLMLQEK